jgi:large exoprotein involved in heme utilization and adhesion
VVLNVGNVSLANDSSINSSASGTGQAGNINISASGSVAMTTGSTIKASSDGSGKAGEVIVTTPALSLNDATITTSTSSTGNAGSITANVGTLTLSNGAEVSSSGTGTASGSAGSITIQGLVSPANSVTITDSSLLTIAANTGQGGSVTVSATNLALNNATVSASVNNFNNSPDSAIDGLGNIDLTASTMTMTGSTVTTESSGARNAGDIKLNPDVAGNSFQMQNSTINTSAAFADGGNIEINATNMVHLTDSIVTSSVGNETKTNTLGGNITIDPQFVILQNSQIIAQAFAGAGGNIDITSNVFLADPNSLVDASSQLGISGTVNIQAPVQNISGELVVLSHDFSSATALLAQQCAARVADGKFSTFVVAAREGLPIELGGFLASPLFLTDGVPALSGQLPQTPRAATEGSLPKYDVRPLQLAKLGNACHR